MVSPFSLVNVLTRTYIHTYMIGSIYIYIHAYYIHTYIHTYIHIHTYTYTHTVPIQSVHGLFTKGF